METVAIEMKRLGERFVDRQEVILFVVVTIGGDRAR